MTGYRRFRHRRRRNYNKKRFPVMKTVKNIGSVASTAYNALRLASTVARMVNTEKKYVDASGTIAPTYTGSVTSFTVSAGTSESQRIGSSIKPLHFTLRGTIYASSVGNEQQYFRLILFRGKQENGVAYTASDILENTGGVYSPFSAKKYDNRFHTKIIWDKLIAVNKSTASTTKMVKFSKKLFGHMTFDGATTNVEDGGLYLLCISDVASNPAALNYYSRLTYTDN